MRSFLLTKLVCAACGTNLEIGDRLPTTAGQCEQGEPTGADMMPTVGSVKPCPCVTRPAENARRALKELIGGEG